MDFEAPDWRLLHSSLARRRRFAFCPVGYYLYHVPGRDGYGNHPDDWLYKLYAANHKISASAWVISLWRRSLREYYCASGSFRKRRLGSFVRGAFEREFNLLENGAYRSDPKTVNSVIELEDNIFNSSYFYNSASLRLDGLINAFQAQDVSLMLAQTPMLDFRYTGGIWAWTLGGVNFSLIPDVVWTANCRLHILDMNSYAFEQEQTASATLFRVYALRFMRIAPEFVDVYNFDPVRLTCSKVADHDDFNTLIRQ